MVITDWQQKWAAITALARGATVNMRRPGDWFVSAPMEHADGASMLVGDYGNGDSPGAAVEEHWRLYGDGNPLHCDGGWFRWNGFMWEKSERP